MWRWIFLRVIVVVLVILVLCHLCMYVVNCSDYVFLILIYELIICVCVCVISLVKLDREIGIVWVRFPFVQELHWTLVICLYVSELETSSLKSLVRSSWTSLFFLFLHHFCAKLLFVVLKFLFHSLKLETSRLELFVHLSHLV